MERKHLKEFEKLKATKVISIKDQNIRNKIVNERNHVYEKNGSWYFEDETEGENGPYLNEEIATTMFDKYCKEFLETKTIKRPNLETIQKTYESYTLLTYGEVELLEIIRYTLQLEEKIKELEKEIVLNKFKDPVLKTKIILSCQCISMTGIMCSTCKEENGY